MGRTILLVDDEANILRSLTRLLRPDGYQILTAESGAQGLEILRQHDVAVIVSDQRMAGMSGTEFYAIVKQEYPSTVRMVLGGYADLNTIMEVINKGSIYKFPSKPWDGELLRNNIKEAFEYYEMADENRGLRIELEKANHGLKEKIILSPAITGNYRKRYMSEQ